MKLVLLGTTGYHPNDQRQTACLMLPEVGVVLDAGTAMFRVRDYLTTPNLDIFLSHAHLDHIVGLTYLLGILHDKDATVTVHGVAEKLAAIREHLFSDAIFPVEPDFECRPLEGSVELAGGGRLTHFPLDHPGGACGFRLDWPQHSMAYVTDTTAAVDAPYVQHLLGVDLLVHECNFPDSMAERARLTGHSCLTPVAQVAKAAGAKRLALVHIDPLAPAEQPLDLAPAKRIFPAVEIGRDRMEIEF